MKNRFSHFLMIALLLVSACKQKSHEHADPENPERPDAVEISENQMLYNEVMKVHDEVMPKLDDIHKKKEALKNQIANTPDMSAADKEKIEARMARLDSASESMMVWMREFNPLPDSTGEERAREYLENEMERVKKVRQNILSALEDTE